MKDFSLFRRGECPICFGASKSCRQSNTTGLIFCRDTAANPTNHVYRGEDTWGFGLWQPITDQIAFSEQASEERKARRQEFLEAESRRRQQLLAQQLPAVERDQWYRKLLDQLVLTDGDRSNLLQRGFTLEQITRDSYRSVTKFEKIGTGYPINLPGILARGFGGNQILNVGGDGILCPIRDQNGLIVSCQLRLHDGIDGRYRWLTSATQTNPDGATSHLNGELPLGVFEPDHFEGDSIWMTEGTGIKPSLTRHKLRVPVVGAAAGRFDKSPETAKAAVEYLCTKYQTKTLTFAIDAGDVVNESGVPERWFSQFEFFQELGYECRVAWWGQITKEHADIDELSTEKYPFIEYISVERFVSLCQKYGGIKPEKNISHQLDFNERVAEVQRKLHTLSYAADIECDPHQKYLPDLVDKIPHQGIVLLHAPMGSGKSVQIDKIKQYLCGGGYWEERPISINNQLSLIPDKQFVLPPTERIWHEGKKMRFLSINARIALGREQAIRWHFTWIEDADLDQSQSFEHNGEIIQTATVLESIDEIGLCWDSLFKLFERDWSNTLVIIDELELGLNHVATSSTCRDRRSKILYTIEKKLKECLEGGGLVIGADANLTDSSYEYLTGVVPGHIPFIVKHNYIRPDSDKWDISFYTGKRDEILSQIENWLSNRDCKPIAVAIDNQSEAEGLANSLVKKYPWLKEEIGGLIRIDSKITQTDFGQNFVKRPNESIERYQPKILIYTPSLGVGCSIDIDYFSYVFGLFFGNLEPSQARQMLARVRKPIPRIVWSKDRASNTESESSSFLPSEIKRRMFEYNDTTTSLIEIALQLAKDRTENLDSDREILPNLVEVLQGMMGKDGSWDNPHVDLYCNQLAKRNFSLSQLAIQLRQELIDEGHNVTDYAADEKTSAGDNVRASKEEIKQHKASMTAHAPDITLDEAKDINRKPNPTESEEYAATKAFLKEELPEVELTSDFLYKAVYADHRRWLNQVKLFWMCFNIDATKELDKKHWKYKLKQFADGVAYLPDVKTYSGKVDIINKIGIFEIIGLDDFEQEYSEKDSSVKEWFTQKVLRHKKLIKNAFGITVSENTQIIKFINKLLVRVGLKLERSRKDTDNITYYKLNEELVLDADRVAVLEALTRRWELQLTPTVQSEAISQEPSATQPDISDHEVIQVENEWLQPGAIEEVAADLAKCEDSETLQLIRQTEIPGYVLTAAAKILPTSTQDKIRRWVLEQNQNMAIAS